MNLSRGPNLSLAGRCSGSGVTEHGVQQRVEIEALVETVGESAEVLVGVLCELEGLMGAVDHRLEVAKHRVDLARLCHFATVFGS